MNQIFFLFLLFCLLFLIETKAINILLCFVGIMLTLAIQLGYNKNLTIIDGQYFSYILILVQVSALTILFGYLLLLFPSLANSNPQIQKQIKKRYSTSYIFLFLLCSFITFLFTYTYNTGGFYIEDYFFLSDSFSPSQPNTEFLRKLGINLYSEENNIIKLIFLTIILLFAIIALFFLVH